jgi:16S rRNA (adenine1518-N6/adenine1519-N6)-dimethyltransferase
MKLSELRSTLNEIRVSPVKSLGQNFLHDRNLARWIVNKAQLNQDDYVIEIGPGLGALTEFALDSQAHILAIEKDRRLVEFLRQRFSNDRLEVLHADALDFDLRGLFGKPRVKLVGNLPYYVASQLLLKFTKYPSPISLWLLMLQDEMARRICAKPGTKDYGALSLLVQIHSRVEYLRAVPANLFFPRPEVDSALVQISQRSAGELPNHDSETVARLVRKGFSQRRKQLRNLVSKDLPEWDEAVECVGFDPRVRAEELTLEQWIELANFADRKASAGESTIEAERLAVVDAEDRVVGEASRRDTHGNNLRHRAVHILVINQQNQIFLQKRSRWKDRHPGLWDSSAAGHVNSGEDYDTTARRELKEELGIATTLTALTKLPASERTGQEFIWLYLARHDGPFQLARAEIEYGDFFPQDLVSKWLKARPHDFAPGFVECWSAFQEKGHMLVAQV